MQTTALTLKTLKFKVKAGRPLKGPERVIFQTSQCHESKIFYYRIYQLPHFVIIIG